MVVVHWNVCIVTKPVAYWVVQVIYVFCEDGCVSLLPRRLWRSQSISAVLGGVESVRCRYMLGSGLDFRPVQNCTLRYILIYYIQHSLWFYFSFLTERIRNNSSSTKPKTTRAILNFNSSFCSLHCYTVTFFNTSYCVTDWRFFYE